MILKISNFWCLCIVFLTSVGGVDIEIGDAINLFHHYGMLANLFPNHANYQETILPIEFSQNIFDRQALKKIVVGSGSSKEYGVWKTKLCENVPKVLNAFFENYHIDFVENIENILSSAASRKSISQLFGIRTRFLMSGSGYVYILIKYRQNNAKYALIEEPNTEFALDARITKALENVTLGDEKSVLHFVSKFGSHYFKSFSIGDIIYQLFAVPENRYQCLKKFGANFVFADILQCVNTSEIWPGFIKTLSNSKTTEEALNNLHKSNNRWYSNLLVAKYQNFGRYVRMPERPVLTGFNLSAISDVIPNPKSSFIHEVINNQMKLRELYLFMN